MNRKDFLSKVFGVGLVSVAGSKFGAKYLISSKEIKEDGKCLYGTLYFTPRAYAERTEAEFREIWDNSIESLKQMAWPNVLKERNRLLEKRIKA